MAIDLYTLCPGGSGKKIKFCCPDLVTDLDKISRMMEGEQYVAALDHITRLEQKPQNEARACLMAVKGLLLRATGQLEPAKANSRLFLEKHPSSPFAMAEQAILQAIEEDALAAVATLHAALEICKGDIGPRVYEALSVVADALVREGRYVPAQVLRQIQLSADTEDPDVAMAVIELNRDPQIPLVMKQAYHINAPAAGSPWFDEMSKVHELLQRGQFLSARRQLSELVERTGDQPAVLLAWAKLLGWIADDEGMRTVLRRFTALDVPLEDAVEAEMLAMLLDDAPLGDAMPVLTLTWTVRDAEKLQERFLSSPLMASLRVDGFEASDDEPPPRAAYLLIDRPQPAADEAATLENIPSWYAQILFYGKQTDREARLVVTQVAAAMVDRAIGQIAEIAGDAIAPEVAREEAGTTSASLDLLERRWHFTRGMSREDAEQLIVAHERRAILEQWPQLKMGAFGGKSPAEAAGDPAMRVKLLAAIGLLEPMRKWVDLDDLRRSLGLPTREAIDPAEQPPLSIALLRLDRLMVEKLSDDDLLTAFRRAIVFGVLVAMRKFSREFLSRPSMAEHPDRMQAYSVAVRTAETPAESLHYIDEARKAVEAKGESGSQWDLIELTHYLTVGNGPEAMRLIQHIERNHIQEPNVGEALMRMLINFGLLRPDGTPNIPTRGAAPMSAPESAAEPNQIWTPEAEQGGGGGKLWVPD